MSDSYGSELCIYKSLTSIADPLEVIVIFDLSEHGFRLDRTPASMHQTFVTGQQFSVHCTELDAALLRNHYHHHGVNIRYGSDTYVCTESDNVRIPLCSELRVTYICVS